MPDLPTGTVTFLFTDVEGSTRLWEQRPEAMRQALVRHDAIIEQGVAAHDGVVVRPRGEGDSRFAVFARASDAVASAVAIQQALHKEPWPTATPLLVRLALHTGEADLREGDYYGSAVNRCARLRAVAHGGQALLSLSTEELVRDALPGDVGLRDLGEQRLRDLGQVEHVYQLMHPDLLADFPPLRSLDTPISNLPLQLTSFVGRERELAAARTLVLRPEVRLLTLIGPGGVGKTRLALALASDLAPAFSDGVIFISLGDLTEPAQVLPAVARAFGVQPGHRDLGEVLGELLRPRRLLLLLDNWEQVAGAAPALAKLLTGCPKLTVLATSRTPLQLSGERVFPVSPLALPGEGTLTIEALSTVEAVALFVARAEAAQPSFALNAENASAVATICRQLDGLPLALELAAARVRLLPPAVLLRRLEHRLALLTTGAADLPARQRTLRATLAWSYDLLRPQEQALFHRLGVFAGGAMLEMAEHVAMTAGTLELDVLEGLDTLVRHSLLGQEEQDGEPRLAMLETVREFALEQLTLAGEAEATRAAHVEALLRRLDGELGPEEWDPWFRSVWSVPELERERENLRLALTWCAERGDSERGLRLASRSMLLWWQTGPRPEGLAWLRRFLQGAPGPPHRLRLRGLHGAAWLAFWAGDVAAMRAYTAEGLALAEALQDEQAMMHFLLHSATLARQDGDLTAAQTAAERLLALSGVIGTIEARAQVLMGLGTIAELRGDPAEAAARYRERLTLPDRANEQYALRNLGYLALEAGRTEEAAARFRAALEDTWSRRVDSAVLENLNAFAALARGRGAWERAARLLGAVDAGIERLGGVLPEPIGRRERERTRAEVREQVGAPAFAAAYTGGRALSLERAVAYALAEDGDA